MPFDRVKCLLLIQVYESQRQVFLPQEVDHVPDKKEVLKNTPVRYPTCLVLREYQWEHLMQSAC